MWAPHHLEPRPRRRQAGGIAPCKGATRRRHAVRRLRMAQNPHRYQYRARCRGGRARLGRRWVAETRQLHTPSGATAKQISPSTSRTAQLPVQNSPSTPPRTACARQNSPCTPEMARFGAFSTCRESFVPLSPPRSQAGRILYRTQGRDEARQHNSTPGPTGVEGTGGSGGHGRASRRGLAAAPRE